MIKREAPPEPTVNAQHRALRRCHGCGSYARPAAEPVDGRLVCEKCFEKARRANDAREGLAIAEA